MTTYNPARYPKHSLKLSSGLTLKYLEAGRSGAPELILLHGVTDTSRSWTLAAPYLERRFHLTIPDLRGHGASEAPQGAYTIPQFAQDIVELMDGLGIRQAAIAGHSMGSFIARQIAIDHPERVSKVVLIASALSGVGNQVLMDAWVALRSFRSGLDPDFVKAWTAVPNPVDPVFFEAVAAETARVPLHVWIAAIQGLLTDDHHAFIGYIHAPALILWGTIDNMFLESDFQALTQAMPQAKTKIYSGVGHCIQWEQPQAVANDIADFLR